MLITSNICETISIINLTMYKVFRSQIDTDLIIDNLLSSEGFVLLTDNLYNNWTEKNTLLLNKDWEGNIQDIYGIEQTLGVGQLLKDKNFCLEVAHSLSGEQKKQFALVTAKNSLVEKFLKDYRNEWS